MELSIFDLLYIQDDVIHKILISIVLTLPKRLQGYSNCRIDKSKFNVFPISRWVSTLTCFIKCMSSYFFLLLVDIRVIIMKLNEALVKTRNVCPFLSSAWPCRELFIQFLLPSGTRLQWLQCYGLISLVQLKPTIWTRKMYHIGT